MTLGKSALAQASPSIALIKYWGKQDTNKNLPATTSIALTLHKALTETRVSLIEDESIDRDFVHINGTEEPESRFATYFDRLRAVTGANKRFYVESINNFPTAAGLASSASGFAALTKAAFGALGETHNIEAISEVSRLGSASAARSVFEGFSILPAGSESALELYPRTYWPQMRVVLVRVSEDKKPISSREAMERTKRSSPYFEAWVRDSFEVSSKALEALAKKDFEQLGNLIRSSFLRMFSTMLSADPPIQYWKPDSLAVQALCQELRNKGVGAYETMDAGPQVKIFCLSHDLKAVTDSLQEGFSHLKYIVDEPGLGARLVSEPELLRNA